MTMYASPQNVDTLRILARADLDEAEIVRGHCDCTEHETCWPHRVLGLLAPTVEAHEVTF